MKLKKEFIVHNAEGESLLVPTGGTGFSGLVRGNRTFGAILEGLREETDEAALIAALCARFDAPEALIAADVGKALAALREVGALEE